MTSQNLSLILFICLLILSSSFLFNNNQFELFDCSSKNTYGTCGTCGTCSLGQTAPAGVPKCGLNGDILRTRPIEDCRYHHMDQNGFNDCYNSHPFQFTMHHREML